MEKIVYYDVETKRFISELEVRKILFDFEIGNIYNNIDEYKEGFLSLENQLGMIKRAIYADIKDVINMLSNNWNTEIRKYKEID